MLSFDLFLSAQNYRPCHWKLREYIIEAFIHWEFKCVQQKKTFLSQQKCKYLSHKTKAINVKVLLFPGVIDV